MQVLERLARESAHALLRDGAKNGVAQLVEERGANARGAVGGEQTERHEHDLIDSAALVERIDDLFEQKRHLHVEHFRETQQRHGGHDAQLGAVLTTWPNVRAEFAQHCAGRHFGSAVSDAFAGRRQVLFGGRRRRRWL
jgi:hypothetical protein